MAADLRSNLKFSGEKFYWDSTLAELKEFVTNELKLSGRWSSPGGEVKLFTADTVSLKWHGKTVKSITLAGNSTEINELSKILTSICESSVENQGSNTEGCQDHFNNDDNAEANMEATTGMNNYTIRSIPVSLNSSEMKTTEAKLNNIDAHIKQLEKELVDKTSKLANDLNNLKKYCLDSGADYMSTLRQENLSLKEENQALKDSLFTAKFALSDLNSKIKELENEKASLTTTLKILYEDFHQAHKTCPKQQDLASGVKIYTNGNQQDKVQINQVENQSDKNIIAGNENGDTDSSVLLVEENSKSLKSLKRKYKKKKSAKKVITQPPANENSNSKDPTGHLIEACTVHEDNDIAINSSTCTGTCPNNASNLNASNLNNKSVEYNLPEDQSFTYNHAKNVTVVVGDSMVKNLQGWRLSTEENHVVVKSFAGATTSDMEDYVKPVIRKEPQKLILHVGTNDLKKLSPNRVAEGIANIATQIQEDSPRTEIVISSLLTRSDKPELSAKVNETNKLINAICCKSKWKFIDHKLINATCLNSRGLHLNRKGTSLLAKNISRYIKSS